jgi:hypothetical protein
MATPAFTHIHCSSRFDRSAESLETDLDDWMSQSSLITVTEVNNDNRAAKLREKGWSYFNSKLNQGQDDVGIAWEKANWAQRTGLPRSSRTPPSSVVRGLSTSTQPQWCSGVLTQDTSC